MNILLIIGSDINEENSTSSFKRIFFEELVKQGHTVTIVYSYRKKIFIKYKTFNNNNTRHVTGTRFYVKEYIPNKINYTFHKQLIKKSTSWKMPYPEGFISKVRKKLEGKYDLVLSISHPVYSHRIAYDIIEQNKISYKKWHQVWFETWFDIFDIAEKSSDLKQDELRLLSKCDRIFYSSNLLIDNHAKIYPSFKSKMKMFNLPSYPVTSNEGDLTYTIGYFGNYNSKVRKFEPFYQSVKKLKIPTIIVGKGDYNLQNNENFDTINKRLPEKECELYEKKSKILIVLCNWFADIIPGKLYKYATWDKPILVILDGSEDMKKYILDTFGKYDKFYFCENSEASISDMIMKISIDLEKKNYTAISEFLPEGIVRDIISD